MGKNLYGGILTGEPKKPSQNRIQIEMKKIRRNAMLKKMLVDSGYSDLAKMTKITMGD